MEDDSHQGVAEAEDDGHLEGVADDDHHSVTAVVEEDDAHQAVAVVDDNHHIDAVVEDGVHGVAVVAVDGDPICRHPNRQEGLMN